MSKNQSVKKRQKLDTHTLSRLLKFIFKNFKLEFIVLAVCVGLIIPLRIVRRVPSLREEARRRFNL